MCVGSGIAQKWLQCWECCCLPEQDFHGVGVLHTRQYGMKACQSRVLGCEASKDSTRGRGAEGASLTHTICVHIEDSPGALNYVWAPYCRELQHIAQMLLLRSAALASHRRLQSTDRYCSFTAPHCPKSAFHPALHADLIYAVFLRITQTHLISPHTHTH